MLLDMWNKQTQRTNTIWSYLDVETTVVKCLESETRMMFSRGGRKMGGEGHRV